MGLRMSLRAKLTLILLLVDVGPLVGASAFFYYSAREAFFRNVFRELKWTVDEAAGAIEDHFVDTGKNLVIASHNTAFTMYFLEPEKRGRWLGEQHRTLRYLRSIYPDILDEACFIESTGKEISRIVYDAVSKEEDLSSEEDRSDFFRKAFEMGEGEVFQGRPAISEDTKRWVLPNATPIMAGGRKAAILHFEITLTYFQKLLKRSVNPDRGYGFIVDDSGNLMAHTLLDMSETGPFPPAVTPSTPEPLRNILARVAAGERGVEEFREGGKDYYIVYRPIRTSYTRGRNENRWAIAYVIPAERVYLETAILRYNIYAVGLIIVLVSALSFAMVSHVSRPIRELARATRSVSEGEIPDIAIRRRDEIGELSASFRNMLDALKKRDEALRALAVTDELTGLFNYRCFKSEIEKAVKGAFRFSRPLSVLLMDIDHFKHYNDTNGHTNGDRALRTVAETIVKNVREVDLAARYGGEEFVVIMPETPAQEAALAAERIRKKVEDEIIPFEEKQPGGALTVSIGVASFPDDAVDAATLVQAADKALYKAKALGRNRVVPAGHGRG